MKVLLIRPKPHKDTLGLQNVMICEPLELESIASNVEVPWRMQKRIPRRTAI